MSKLVSVIMPAYNCVDFIGESIRSVQRQTYRDWELIIADDCSSDATVQVVRDYAKSDARIKLIECSDNLGPSGARNRALSAATGTYVAFLDSDDVWYEQKLEKQVAFMQEGDFGFSYTAYEKLDEQGNPTGVVVKAPERVDYDHLLFLGDPIGNLTVMIDCEKLGRLEVPTIRKRNDFALWLRALRMTDYAYGLDEVLAGYRVRKGSVSSNKLGLMKYHWELYRKIEKLPLTVSSAAMLSLVAVKQTKNFSEQLARRQFVKSRRGKDSDDTRETAETTDSQGVLK